jgi:hypothetical protein
LKINIHFIEGDDMFLIQLEVKLPNIKKYTNNDKCIITLQFGLFTIIWLNATSSALLKILEIENIEDIANHDVIINDMQKKYDDLENLKQLEAKRLTKCITGLQEVVHNLTVLTYKKNKKIRHKKSPS